MLARPKDGAEKKSIRLGRGNRRLPAIARKATARGRGGRNGDQQFRSRSRGSDRLDGPLGLPIRAVAGDIRFSKPLGDNPLGPGVADLREELGAAADDMRKN